MREPTTGCPKCNYTGFHHADGDDTRVIQCICSYAKTLKAYLGPEIASASTITRSPLFELAGKGEEPKVDRTQDNLFIKSYWSDLLPHLKWTLACKGPMFRYRIVTDEKLKTVFVGNESYKTRAKDVRDDIETYNSLGDIVGSDLDLVILRLGFLGYKNIAMPGILKEALMLRESAFKPTWLIDAPSNPFEHGHFSYSEDVQDYVARRYEVLDMVDRNRKPPHELLVEQDSVGLSAHTSEPEPVRRPIHTPEPIDDMGAVMGKPKFKKGTFKKNGGGGPV